MRRNTGGGIEMNFGPRIEPRLILTHWRQAGDRETVAINLEPGLSNAPIAGVVFIIARELQRCRARRKLAIRDQQGVPVKAAVELNLIESFAVSVKAVAGEMAAPLRLRYRSAHLHCAGGNSMNDRQLKVCQQRHGLADIQTGKMDGRHG